jgi:hypothetical protein
MTILASVTGTKLVGEIHCVSMYMVGGRYRYNDTGLGHRDQTSRRNTLCEYIHGGGTISL